MGSGGDGGTAGQGKFEENWMATAAAIVSNKVLISFGTCYFTLFCCWRHGEGESDGGRRRSYVYM